MNNSPSDEPKTEAVEADDFPARLKQAMGGSSIRGFARECGFSDTVLRQYLNGQSEPTRPALLAMARTANVRVEWLASGQVLTSTQALAASYIFKEPLAFKSSWLQEQWPEKPDHCLLAEVPDESMEPTLKQGDLVLIDTSDRDLDTINHGIYLLKLDDRILVKRLQYVAEKTLRVLSDSPVYETFSVELAKKSHGLSIMGKVVWYGRKL
jgi:transcriptional regulator with XRE-family HTH domain